MTKTLLGLPVRWQTSFDWNLLGSLAPRHLGGRVVARAGRYLVGLDPATGALLWKYQVEGPILDGWVLEVCGEVAITDWSEDKTSRGHLVGVDADGRRRWEVDLPSAVGTRSIRLDDRSVAAVVFAEKSELAIVDADGGVSRRRLPSPGSRIAHLPDGRWVVGQTGITRGKPRLYLMSGDTWRGVEVAAEQVPVVVATDEHVITVERTGDDRELVVRDHDLVARWRAPVASEFIATTPGQIWMATGDRESPVPTAADLTTGEVRWRGETLPAKTTRIAASGDLVVIGSWEGAMLLTASGTILGHHEGDVGALDTSGDGVLLYVDDAVTCLEHP